jgi:tRNA(Ser,Leu) C12 N-acetylase TAN1
MMEWNILATSFKGRERYLIRFLNNYGNFRGSGFRDVIRGRVEDVNAFLETLKTLQKEDPKKLRSLSQVVPLEKTFLFELTDLSNKLKEAISSYVELLENRRFYVRARRRGHKGEVSSQELEKEMDAYIMESLDKLGRQANVNIEESEMIIVVETIGNWAGVGLITREMKEKYNFIRIK